ncbi:MAG: hypothetical protein A2Y40_08805 [Candidatus Margulisbacteria bacterium GWF2_35_9]|nr:MAG: hypothetical protein A2Y40_08805 [Candidatus Margulisbacteria bacterium GWF2_35_9]
MSETYKRRLFSPWHQPKPSTTSQKIHAMTEKYTSSNWYAENKKPKNQMELNKLKTLSNIDNYPNNIQKAISIRNTNLRKLPTNKPQFHDFNIAGEGFPFDMLQNSGIPINTPLLICHISSDKAWVYIESAFAAGWVPVSDIAYVDDFFQFNWQRLTFYTPLTDDLNLIDTNGIYRGSSRIGSLIPKANNKLFIISDIIDFFMPNNDYTDVLAVEADQNRQAYLVECKIQANKVKPWPIESTPANIAMLADSLMGQAYGWGDLFGNRDCSSSLKDLFAAFGKWLPRNGNDQANSGKFISLNNLSDEEKLTLIRSEGIAMITLLWFRGHIMLYLGVNEFNTPLVFHNVWGMKVFSDTDEEGRLVIGKTVITTLEAAKERSDVKINWLNRLEGMILL